MSDIGRLAGGKHMDAECVVCKNRFQIPLAVVFDGGTVHCPNCGTAYNSDGSAGREVDRILGDFRRSIERLNRRLRFRL